MARKLTALLAGMLLSMATATGNGQTKGRAALLPLTTKSAEARRLVEEAMTLDLDQVELLGGAQVANHLLDLAVHGS